MPSDAERWRFLERFKLTTSWHDKEWTLFWREKSYPWKVGELHVISKGATLAEATDAAIERYNRKHGIAAEDPLERPSGVRWLQVRGCVS